MRLGKNKEAVQGDGWQKNVFILWCFELRTAGIVFRKRPDTGVIYIPGGSLQSEAALF